MDPSGTDGGQMVVEDALVEGQVPFVEQLDEPLVLQTVLADSADVGRQLLNMEPGEYVVEETEWSWAYEKGTTTMKNGTDETTSSVNGTGTGTVAFNETLEFTFTGAPLANVTKHAEDAQTNQFAKEERP